MKLSDIVLYNGGRGGEDGNNYWKKYRTPHYIYIFLMLLLMGIGIGLTSLMLCSVYLTQTGFGVFVSYLREPLVLLMNLLPCVLLVFLFYFATGRAWAAFTFPALIVFVLSLVNYYKIRIRSEALVARDMTLIGETAGIISHYELEISGRVLLMALAFVVGVIFSVFLMRGKLKNKLVRIIGSVATIAVCALLYTTVYTSESVYNAVENDSAGINPWSELQVYVSKGFIYPFIYTVQDAFPQPPEGYEEGAAREIFSQYEDVDIPEDERVNIIAVMFESYTDLSQFPQVGVKESVYEPFHQLQRECLQGHIISNTFAGGTVDSERNFLTGYTKMDEYRVPTNSYVYYLRQQGYWTEGLHTGDSWFYRRDNVEAYLGMEEYYFLEDLGTQDRSDELFFSTLTELYRERDPSKPYFNFSITYQNHGAYETETTVEESYLERGDMNQTSYNILNNYLSGIADTSQRMLDFVDSLRDDEEPVVVVFFGDHMPWLGDGNSVYNELGINIDLSTAEGVKNYYCTPYLIWANDAAKEATGGSFTGAGEDISACFLMDRVFEECGWQGSAFMQMNRQLRERVTGVNTGSRLYLVDGKLTETPEGKAMELLRRYRWVEYYLKSNFMYDDMYGG